jgi:hypothetical protein
MNPWREFASCSPVFACMGNPNDRHRVRCAHGPLVASQPWNVGFWHEQVLYCISNAACATFALPYAWGNYVASES